MKIFNKFIWSKKEPSNKNDIWFDGSTWRMYTEEAWQSFTLPVDAADKLAKVLENASEVYQEKLNAGYGIVIEGNTISLDVSSIDVNTTHNIGSIELFDQIIAERQNHNLTQEDKDAILNGKIITTSAGNGVVPTISSNSMGENGIVLIFHFNERLYEMFVMWTDTRCYINGVLSFAKEIKLSEEIVIKKGDAENSAVLKGGDNRTISEGGVALGKNNIVGLKGWYYKAMSISKTGYVYLYLSSDQQLPSFVSSANEVEQENDIICDLKEGDICCIINGNKFINVFAVKYNHIKQYGRIGFSYIGEGDNPIDGIITTEEINKGNLSLDDYCVYCLNKPDIGNVNISESALAEGKLTKSLNSYTHAEGLRSVASGKTSHVEGQDNIASGECSHAEGAYTKSTGDASHAEGFNTEASELSAHAEGYGTLASNGASHAEGSATKATGLHSHAEGDTTEASGKQSHAEGFATTASGACSHAEGGTTTALGVYSHAEGASTRALGDCSHAEGANAKASGDRSHAEGENTTASGERSHAEGYGTTAKGSYSHAEGYNTTAEGNYSHAEGYGTTANGSYSHAEGMHTITTNTAEHASGKYNQSTNSTDSAKATFFSIGIGTSKTDRKNAVEVKANGDIYIIGVGGYDGTNSDSAQTLQEILANL